MEFEVNHENASMIVDDLRWDGCSKKQILILLTISNSGEDWVRFSTAFLILKGSEEERLTCGYTSRENKPVRIYK